MIKQFTGFVLTETSLGESSKIINILTKESGIIGVVAKNSKSIKNPLRAKSTKFTYGTFHIYYYENKLSKLVDVDIIDNLNNLKNNILLVSYMSYITELTSILAKNNYHESIYNIFINTLLKLNQEYNPMILTNILEIKYLKYLGIEPNLESCYNCNNQTNIITVSTSGGFVCQKCYQNEPILPSKVIKTLRLYKVIDISKISKLDIDEETTLLVDSYIDEYYELHSGLYLKSKKFLQTIK